MSFCGKKCAVVIVTKRAKANQLVYTEQLLALIRELVLGDTKLPTENVLADFGAHGTADDLVAEADAADRNARSGGHPHKILQRLHPWQIIVNPGAGAGQHIGVVFPRLRQGFRLWLGPQPGWIASLSLLQQV